MLGTGTGITGSFSFNFTPGSVTTGMGMPGIDGGEKLGTGTGRVGSETLSFTPGTETAKVGTAGKLGSETASARARTAGRLKLQRDKYQYRYESGLTATPSVIGPEPSFLSVRSTIQSGSSTSSISSFTWTIVSTLQSASLSGSMWPRTVKG
jgi:hypothetical protein